MYTGSAFRWYLVLLIIIAISPAIALGQGLPTQIVPQNCSGPNAAASCTVCDIATLAQNVLNFGIYLAVFLAAILFAWAGLKFLTNRSNPSEISKAKSIFFNVMVGLVGILAAWLLIDTIMFTFTGTHLWGQLC